MLEIGQCPACRVWLQIPASREMQCGLCPHCRYELSVNSLRESATAVQAIVPLPSTLLDHSDETRLPPLEQMSPSDLDGLDDGHLDDVNRPAETIPVGPTDRESASEIDETDDDRMAPLNDEIPSPFVATDEHERRSPLESDTSSLDRDGPAELDRKKDDPINVDVTVDEGGRHDDPFAEIANSADRQSPASVVPMIRTDSVRSKSTARQKNPVIELIKIVAGGIAGLLIAQLALWWLPGDMRRDPFQLAPQLPRWLHILLPTELRAAGSTQLDDPVWDAPPGAPLGPLLEQRPYSTSVDPPSAPADRRHDDSRASMTADPFDDEATSRAPASISALVERVAGQSEMIRNHDPSREDDLTAVMATFSDETNDGSASLAVDSAPSYSSAQLQSALSRAMTSLAQLGESARDTRRSDVGQDNAAELETSVVQKETARTVYTRLCEVAQIVAYLDRRDPDAEGRAAAAHAMLRRIANDRSLFAFIGRTAADWMRLSTRSSDGLVLAGEVVGIEQVDNWHVTQIQLLDVQKTVLRTIRQNSSPSFDNGQAYRVGSRIIMFGSILDPPQESLPSSLANMTIVRHAMHVCDSQ